ncbi:DUF2637 domain-containing protein [Streptomyces albipurpureus]|uniref:DUF2637 domain-containing protein n=1 Tax=Streptomyces albipurpureus TaxID=2897419 RepID=A0ABT0UVM8_9ACTN|nr:DUF2637 domain-containing protein [Streptomyces sp. CWNU-1]MCM2392504.1 DUF2637 domain-containing protein [Streptomyces sp. CWNU-1]
MNRFAKALLVVALVGVVGMAFRVSWNALKDVATATGADGTAALLYPFVVDGLMALALVAALVLTDRDRDFALRVLAAYTVASLVLNYVHGLHGPAVDGGVVDWSRLAGWDPAHWALVLLATSLPVGSIYFGSDLVAKVLHHQQRSDPTADRHESVEIDWKDRSGSELQESTRTAAPTVAELPPGQSTEQTAQTEAVDPGLDGVDPVGVESTSAARSTGPVPESARSSRPNRTPDELLTEARSATADWSDSELTGEAIRRAVRTSSANGRTLRDALRAERATSGESGAVAA